MQEIYLNIGSEHHEIIIEKNELLSFFDRMPEIYDEPFEFIPNSYSYNFKLCKKKLE